MNPPPDFHFDGQKNGEKVLLVLRRHWFNILSQFLVVFFLLIFLIGSYLIVPLFMPQFSRMYQSGRLLSFGENLLAMLTWITFFAIWVDYYFDIWIVTDQRIINIEQKGLFNRSVSELELPRIQDVTAEIQGIIPTFFTYGDVYIQTAAEQDRFHFRQIPDPYGVKDMIMRLQKKLDKSEANELGEIIQKKIHDELHEDLN